MACATKADEAADAGSSMFELHPVQSTAAVSWAGQVETSNEEVTSTIEVDTATQSTVHRTQRVR